MLTDTRCRNARPKSRPYKLGDGGGLHLLVRPSGKKVFQYRFELPSDGAPSRRKEGTYTIGEYVRAPPGESEADAKTRSSGGRVTLAEARVQRDRARDLVRQGINPNHERKLRALDRARALATTFELVAREWIAAKEWEKETRRRRLDTLQRVAFPSIGALPIADIRSTHVLTILLDARDNNGPTVAAEARRSMHGIFELAVATLRAEENPVERVKGAVKVPKTRHKRHLKAAEIGELMRDLRAYERNFQTVAAFRLMWWTLCRPGEVTGARWEEIDLEHLAWVIPASRMKKRETHRVPLPTQAREVLSTLRALTSRTSFVFPHRDRPNAPMTIESLRQATYNLGWKGRYTPYATRTTGSTALNELGYNRDWIERQLDHRERDAVRRSYNRAEYFDERRVMMQDWADLLERLEAGQEELRK